MGRGIDGERRLSRRNLLASTGVAAAGVLAGCPGESTDGDGDGADGDGDGAGTRVFVTEEANSPENVNYNRFDDTFFPGQSAELLFGSFYRSTAGQDTDGDGVLPELMKVEDGPWEDVGDQPTLVIEDDEFILPLHEHFTWQDGDPVTARDVVTLLELERLRGHNMWEPLENVEVVDDYAVRFETVPDVFEPLVVDRAITVTMSVKHDVFEQFLPEEPIESLSEGQRTVRAQELIDFTWNDPEEVIGWGPFELTERGQTETRLTLNEDYPHADEIDIDEIRNLWFSAEESLQQHFITGEFDGIHDTPARIVGNELPDAYEPYPYDTRVGLGLAFNYDHDWFGKREVRQAFAFALDRERMVSNSGWSQEWVEPHTFDTGFLVGRDLHDEWFGDGFVDELTHYGHDPDRASELLREAGWERDGDEWFDSSGERAELELTISQTPGEWANMIENAAQQLDTFGIDATASAQNVQVYYGVTMPGAQYEAAGWIVGEGRPMPYLPLRVMWTGSEAVDVSNNHPAEVEVPWPPGDPDGDLRTVDYLAKIEELARTPEDESTELFQELVWIYNQWLPVYSLNRQLSAGWLHTDRWQGPDPKLDEASTFQPLTRLLRGGHIEPTG